MRRRVLSLLLVWGLLAPLVACTPGSSGKVAIRKVDGGFELMQAACSNDWVNYVSLFENDGSPARAWTISGSSAVGTITVFAAPAGWEVDDGSLSRLEPGVTYSLLASTDKTERSGLSNFTLDQLNALKDGEVLARTSELTSHPVALSDFTESAADECR